MRFSVAVPVTWPTQDAWATWWRRAAAELDGIEVDEDGTVIVPDEHAGPDDPEVRLTAGEHLRPGALYTVTFRETRMLTMAVGIGGSSDRRLVHARLRNLHHRGQLTLDLDSIDAPEAFMAHSDIEHLGGAATLRPDRDRPADVEVLLDWLRVRTRLSVRAGAQGDELVAEGSITGRGRWRPVLGPLLSTVGRVLPLAVKEALEEVGQALTELAEDPTAGPLGHEERRRRHVARAAQVMSHRAEVVADTMAHRSWWSRRRPHAWVKVLASLPSPTWPPHQTFERWSKREQVLLLEYARFHRREPPTWVGQELVRQEEASRLTTSEHVRHEDGQVALARDRLEESPAPRPPSIDEQLDLGWLATPRSTMRRIRGRDDPTIPT